MTDSATQRVEVSITMNGPLGATTLTKSAMPYEDHNEMQAGLLHDLIGLVRADLQVEEEDVWTFGKEFEGEVSDD